MVIKVFPFISDATSTLVVPPELKSTGDPDSPDDPVPRRTITSFEGSKSAIITLPSTLVRTDDPSALKVTSYK